MKLTKESAREAIENIEYAIHTCNGALSCIGVKATNIRIDKDHGQVWYTLTVTSETEKRVFWDCFVPISKVARSEE